MVQITMSHSHRPVAMSEGRIDETKELKSENFP